MRRVHTRHTANSVEKRNENQKRVMSHDLYVVDLDVETVHLDDVAVGLTVRVGKSSDDAYTCGCYKGAKRHDRTSIYELRVTSAN